MRFFLKAQNDEEIERLVADLKKFIHTVIGKINGDFASVKLSMKVIKNYSTQKNFRILN